MGAASLLLTACGGFLLAILWMDLMFDVQVLGHGERTELPEAVLVSIASYYRRATTSSRPMSYLIALAMAVLLGALAFQAIAGHDPAWLLLASVVLAGFPILLAALRTVPNAVRLGARGDGPADQTRLARSIFRDHLVCLGCILAFLAVRLVAAA